MIDHAVTFAMPSRLATVCGFACLLLACSAEPISSPDQTSADLKAAMAKAEAMPKAASTRKAASEVDDKANSHTVSEIQAAPPGSRANGQWPICGVLTDKGYGDPESLNLVVPQKLMDKNVSRYHVTDVSNHIAPLSVYTGWWLCVTKGRIQRPANGANYGVILIDAFALDQTSAERGQE